jgi:glycogen debranching enzyme
MSWHLGCKAGACEADTVDDHIPAGADFHIQASPQVAAIQKLVLKRGESFLVSDRYGDFPAHFEGELGFYHEGTRHVRWLELRLNGERPLLLNAEIPPGNDRIVVGMTNADGEGPAGVAIPRNTIYLDRHLSLRAACLHQMLTISSFHGAACEVTLELIFNADFRDVFEVRGMHREERGRLLGEERDGDAVRLRYRGLDGVLRTTTLVFDPPPMLIAANRAVYRLTLVPNSVLRLQFTVTAAYHDAPGGASAPPAVTAAGPAAAITRIITDSDGFNVLLARSLVDLEMLLTDTPQGLVPYAGVPWYVAPFGRDSLITALQLLPYNGEIAAGTLRFLAHWQGRTENTFLDEEPGKILHEYRRGEMANCREIPFIPYYGSVDATPLFVVLLAEYARWTGDLALAGALWPAARAALDWMSTYGDRDGDGYLEYATRSRLGLSNQGWKDSGDAVMHADGALARPPIALAEVQGYAYAAYEGAAELAQLLGDDTEAARWRRRAEALRAAFNRDFWLEHEGFYSLALDGDKRPCEVITSNPGHCLWTGVVDENQAGAVAKRLLAPDMFSGWGIRTLSARERRYNPMSYHNGSVWPHDNAIAVAGLRRYRLAEHALTVATALVDAARCFEHGRLPELFCGFPRHADHGPIAYPVSCAPQAWAAGSVLQLVTALIGLEADAASGRLTCHSPMLPPWLRWVEIHDLRVGSSSFDLGISRGRDGASVELIARHGDAELLVRR